VPSLLYSLSLNVPLDYFQGRSANRYQKIRWTPQMPSPHPVLECGKFLKQSARRNTFHTVDNLRQLVLRLRSKDNLYMINVSLNRNGRAFSFSQKYLNHFLQPVTALCRERLVPIFHAPDQVAGEQICRVRGQTQVRSSDRHCTTTDSQDIPKMTSFLRVTLWQPRQTVDCLFAVDTIHLRPEGSETSCELC
jgi:hypothetical protein